MRFRPRDWTLLVGAGVASGIAGRYVESNWWASTVLTMGTLLAIFPALKHVMRASITFFQWAAVVVICGILAWLLHAVTGI